MLTQAAFWVSLLLIGGSSKPPLHPGACREGTVRCHAGMLVSCVKCSRQGSAQRWRRVSANATSRQTSLLNIVLVVADLRSAVHQSNSPLRVPLDRLPSLHAPNTTLKRNAALIPPVLRKREPAEPAAYQLFKARRGQRGQSKRARRLLRAGPAGWSTGGGTSFRCRAMSLGEVALPA